MVRVHFSISALHAFSKVLRRDSMNSVFRSVRRFVRLPVQRLRKFFGGRVTLVRSYVYDWTRFSKYACPYRDFTENASRLAYIQMLAHSIEKGLALPSPRTAFGESKIRMLMSELSVLRTDILQYQETRVAIAALSSYAEFNRSSGTPVHYVESFLSECRFKESELLESRPCGGVLNTSREEVLANSQIDLAEFFESRYSIRQFSDVPIDIELMREAVRMAQKTPSVCNRQSARVYVFDNRSVGSAVRECQNGNRGFGHLADKIVVVTSDLQSFLSVGERNQCWIDGGMFAMSLIYSLHSLGLGTCCLNWAVEKDADMKLRSVAGIPPSENVIMLIAVGHLPERFTVARSMRKPLEEILRDRTEIGLDLDDRPASSRERQPDHRTDAQQPVRLTRL